MMAQSQVATNARTPCPPPGWQQQTHWHPQSAVTQYFDYSNRPTVVINIPDKYKGNIPPIHQEVLCTQQCRTNLSTLSRSPQTNTTNPNGNLDSLAIMNQSLQRTLVDGFHGPPQNSNWQQALPSYGNQNWNFC